MLGVGGDALRDVVSEVEAHVDGSGWDQPGRLFALVSTRSLVTDEPEIAAELGIQPPRDPDTPHYTAVEQEPDDPPLSIERLLTRIEWPATVDGALAVVQRLVLPPEAEADLPTGPDDAARFALAHPFRNEVRMAVGVLRGGPAHCVVRVRSDDPEKPVLQGRDLVPALVSALRATLDETADPEVS